MRVAILISGRGSNMRALIAHAAKAGSGCEIALVLANRPQAEGLAFAAGEGIETLAIDHTQFTSRDAFDQAVNQALHDRKIDLVCLAGFMRILTDGFIANWQGKILNIHPSLLPAFKGTKVHEQALAAGVLISGCTVHFVVPELDSGPIIGQAAVPVKPDDTAATLGARVLEMEHKLYPACLDLVVGGHVRLAAGKAVFTGGQAPSLLYGG